MKLSTSLDFNLAMCYGMVLLGKFEGTGKLMDFLIKYCYRYFILLTVFPSFQSLLICFVKILKLAKYVKLNHSFTNCFL